MHNKMKKYLLFLLAAAMAAGLFIAAAPPVAVNAANPPKPPTGPDPTKIWDFGSVTEDGSGVYGGGSWSWVQATKTLTLKNINFQTTGWRALSTPVGATIVLDGTNTLKTTINSSGTYGISAQGDLTITGGGTLNVSCGTGTDSTWENAGILVWTADSTLTIGGSATVNANGGATGSQGESYGIALKYSGGVFVIEDSATVTATGGALNGSAKSYGVYARGGIYINGGSLTASGNTNALYSTYTVPSGYTYYMNTTTTPSNTAQSGDGTKTINTLNKWAKVVASTGKTLPTASYVNANAPAPRTGTQITGSYSYNAGTGAGAGTQSGSKIQWYKSKSNTWGAEIPTAISGATSLTYRPVYADIGYYLYLQVMPSNGRLLGTAVQSLASGEPVGLVVSLSVIQNGTDGTASINGGTGPVTVFSDAPPVLTATLGNAKGVGWSAGSGSLYGAGSFNDASSAVPGYILPGFRFDSYQPITITAVFIKEAAEIDISTLGNTDISNGFGQAAWKYTQSNKTLTLMGAGGLYTLYGTNDNLSIVLPQDAADAYITLRNIDSASAGTANALNISANCEIRLDGANKLTSKGTGRGIFTEREAIVNITQDGSLDVHSSGNSGIYVDGFYETKLIISGGASVNVTCMGSGNGVVMSSNSNSVEVARDSILTVNGGIYGLYSNTKLELTVDGTAIFNSSTSDGCGIYLYNNDLTINGDGTIYATGATGIRCYNLKIDAADVTVLGQINSAITIMYPDTRAIYMDDAAILKITGSGGAETHRFIKTGESDMHIWKLVDATTPDALTDDEIRVTITASKTGIITREDTTPPPIPVTAAAITGVTSPVRGAAPSTAIGNGAGFTASLAWDGAPAAFAPGSVYTATIKLTAAGGYTFGGGYGNTAEIAGFKVNGVAPVWVSNNGAVLTFKVTFPATAPTDTGGGTPGGGSGGGGGGGGGVVDLPNPSPPLAAATPSPTPALSTSPAPTAKPDNMLSIPSVAPRPRSFTDVPATYWAKIYIEELAKNHIIDGYPEEDDTFSYKPDNNITRAEVIKLLVASLQLELEYEFDGSRFTDWDEVEDWAKPYVGAAVNAGFVYGSLEGGLLYVNANSNITRQETVAMAVRVLDIDVEGWKPPAAAPDFEEAEDWAQPTLAFAVNNKMINTDQGLIRPLADATRAETAMVLFKMLKYIYG